MPTYEYECTRCAHAFEVFQSFDEKPRSRCPVCRGKLRKVIHPVGIIFKGSGWYATDSRPDSEKAKFSDDGKDTTEKTEKTEKTGEPVASKASKTSDGAAGSSTGKGGKGGKGGTAGKVSKDSGTTSGAD